MLLLVQSTRYRGGLELKKTGAECGSAVGLLVGCVESDMLISFRCYPCPHAGQKKIEIVEDKCQVGSALSADGMRPVTR